MAAITGVGGKVMYGSVVLANIDEWSMTGFTQQVTDIPTPFGSTIKTYKSLNIGDPGKISFKGNYDPADSGGQALLQSICSAGTELTSLYLYANTSTFWRVGTGGVIIVTKANAITLPRNKEGTISFEGQVSGAAMEQVGTGT